jgi:hypothetical protein
LDGFLAQAVGSFCQNALRELVETPKALTNFSPGLEQPWVSKRKQNER